MTNTAKGPSAEMEEKSSWDDVAAAWNDAPPQIQQEWALNGAMLDKLDAQAGQTILELAAGLGDLGFSIAAQLGEGGKLITSDISEAMLGYAQHRAEDKGLRNVKFQLIDAQKMELPDSSVDGVLCRFGLMLMPDQRTAVSEIRRVLREGGRAVVATWAGPEKNPWIAAPGMALITNGHGLPGLGPFDEGGVFSLADQGGLSELFKTAGFDEVDVQLIEDPWSFASFEDYWIIPTQISGPIAVVLRDLREDEVAKVRDALVEILEPYRTGNQYVFPRAALCLSATRS